jgi:predicted NBD/HSP70 family sugar kinase
MVATVASATESRFWLVDTYLKQLADAGLDLTRAEEAADAGETGQAEDALDRAADALARLRAGWPAMTAPERAIVGPAAAPLRERLDRTRARLPRRHALSEGAPERDPDEERDPAEAA